MSLTILFFNEFNYLNACNKYESICSCQSVVTYAFTVAENNDTYCTGTDTDDGTSQSGIGRTTGGRYDPEPEKAASEPENPIQPFNWRPFKSSAHPRMKC